MTEANIDLGGALKGAVVNIANEAAARLETPITERDALALTTAIIKAANAGARIAIGHIWAVAEDQMPPDVKLNVTVHIDDADDWADRYGDADA